MIYTKPCALSIPSATSCNGKTQIIPLLIRAWLSQAVARNVVEVRFHLFLEQGVAGSNPATPTIHGPEVPQSSAFFDGRLRSGRRREHMRHAGYDEPQAGAGGRQVGSGDAERDRALEALDVDHD